MDHLQTRRRYPEIAHRYTHTIASDNEWHIESLWKEEVQTLFPGATRSPAALLNAPLRGDRVIVLSSVQLDPPGDVRGMINSQDVALSGHVYNNISQTSQQDRETSSPRSG
jgi:hypothetical protein